MLLLGNKLEGDAKISHLCLQLFKLTISVYMGDIETTLWVQFVDLLDYILNVLHFYIFNHTYCSKYIVLGCVILESNAVGVNEVTAQGDIILPINNYLGEIWCYYRLHMLDLVTDCFDFQMWHTGYIDVLSHSNILSKD